MGGEVIKLRESKQIEFYLRESREEDVELVKID